MKKKIGKNVIWGLAVTVLMIVYLGIFTYLNLAKYEQHVDSDIAAEALLAREIWEQKTLTPDDWIASTERYLFGMPMVASVFYGLTGSMKTAVGIACILIGAAVIAAIYYALRKLELSRLASGAALLVIMAIPINGLRNEGQMVPFVALLLFVFADYYALHTILLFLSIVYYLHLKEMGATKEKLGRKDIFAGLCLLGFATLISCGGQRCLQMVILPLVIYEIICLFLDSEGFSKKLPVRRYWATGFIGLSLLGYIISSMYQGQADYVMYLQDPAEILSRVLITVPAALLEGFGIAGSQRVGNFGSLMQMLVWAFLALVIYGLVYMFRKKNQVLSRQREAMLLLLTSLGITVGIICITTAEAAHNYLLVSWFVAMLAVAVLVDAFRNKKSLFSDIILIAVCVFALLNLKYTWKDAACTTDNLREYEEVAEFMIDADIEYGYAEFWDAERITMVVDGAVTMGCAYGMEDLKMYWWLTSKQWYPPNLPTDMKVAYVVKISKKDAFLGQFGDASLMELQFENERFAVYVSDKNFMRIQ